MFLVGLGALTVHDEKCRSVALLCLLAHHRRQGGHVRPARRPIRPATPHALPSGGQPSAQTTMTLQA
jgi:hypothetical protein